jgi:cysteine desulfurase/selenocysteine lyase
MNSIRDQFPIFQAPYKRPLAYLDTAASSQKPKVVIDRLCDYLSYEHANIHRGAYSLSAKATEHYEEARAKIAKFLGAPDESSILFTRGTTESINLVARSLEHLFSAGDSILISVLEHHSNIVPWQLLASRKKLTVHFADINEDATINIEDFKKKLAVHRPKLVSLTHTSNVFGTVVPIKEIAGIVHESGALMMVDAAQSVPHGGVNVVDLGADFVAFSAHKLYGPTGIGVLYVRPDRYALMEPFCGGGDMISNVTIEGSTWAEPPRKFEAGTPPIAEAIAFGTAIDFVSAIGVKKIAEHEAKLFAYAFDKLSKEQGVRVYGPALNGKEQVSILPFNVDRIHPHDLATIADEFNVQFRGGHHCAIPALKRLGLGATARASFGVYSEPQDIDALCEAIRHAKKMLW